MRPPNDPYGPSEVEKGGGHDKVMPHKKRTVKVRMKHKDLPQSYLVRMVKAREKQVSALKLRASGATYKDIARTVGYANESSARKAVIAAIEKWGKEEAQEIFAQDLVRLDEYTLRLTERLRNQDDVSQIDRLLRVMQQRWTLLGLMMNDPQNPSRTVNTQNVQNNGVLVITGSERRFVEGMMEAIGVPTDTPEAQKVLLELESGDSARHHTVEKIAGSQTTRKNKKSKSKSVMSEYEQADIIDAEIVEEEI